MSTTNINPENLCEWEDGVTITESGSVAMKCRKCGKGLILPPSLAKKNVSRVCKIKEPGLATKAKNFAAAAASHIKAGKPIASQEDIQKRYKICLLCEFFIQKSENKGKCGKCGCTIRPCGQCGRNKLRWAESVCPVGKWGKVCDIKQKNAEDVKYPSKKKNTTDVECAKHAT